MDILYSVEFLAVTAFGLALGVVALVVMQMNANERLSKLLHPAEEDTLKRAEEAADAIIREARARARDIVAGAEAESLKTVESRAEEGERAYQEYLRSLGELQENLVAGLSESAQGTREHSAKLAEQFAGYLEGQKQDVQKEMGALSERIRVVSEHIEAEAHTAADDLKSRADRVAQDIEKALEGIQVESREQIIEYLQKRFTEAEEDIEAYKRGRKDLIDRHVGAIAEDIVRTVMHKELSKKDHADLVRQALEEAKEVGAL